jgi:hypothetical protein
MSESDTSLTWNLTTVADTSAPDCDLVRQWLREHNRSVNYLTCGFKIVGQIPDLDSHGHSKIYFSKHPPSRR